MLDLQATLEFAVELSKFHNIDLFQRGFYQVRLYLKSSVKSPLQYEVTLPRYFGQECAYPPLIQDKTGISKTFQILYKNEEAEIGDFFIFKVYVLVDSKKIAESLSEAELQLQVDLHFRTSEDPPSCAETLDLISSRTVRVHLDSCHAIHSHIPLLFDYFHLSTLDLTVHGTLLGLHQATFSAPKPPKSSWMGKLSTNNLSPSRQPSDVPTMESVLFGDLRPPPVAAKASPNEIEVAGAQLGQAYQIYRTMAAMLLNRRQSLATKFQELMPLTPQSDEFKLEVTDVAARLEIMCEIVRGLINTDDIVEAVNTSMAQLSGEVCLLWTQFLEFFGQNSKVVGYLRQQYHQLRMHRFAEGYFHCNHSPMDLISQAHFTPQDYLHVTSSYRSSAYCNSIRPLPLECTELDGLPNEMPVIFEDVFAYSASTPTVTKVVVSDTAPEEVSPTLPSTTEESDSGKNNAGGNGHRGKKPKRKSGKRRVKYTPVSSIKHIRPEFLRWSKPSRSRQPLQQDLSCYQAARNPCLKMRANSLDADAELSTEEMIVTNSVSLPSIPVGVSLVETERRDGIGADGKDGIGTDGSSGQGADGMGEKESGAILGGGHDTVSNTESSVISAIDEIRDGEGSRTIDTKEACAILTDSLHEEAEERTSVPNQCNGHDSDLVRDHVGRGGNSETLSLGMDDIALVLEGSTSGDGSGRSSSDSLERIPNGYYEEPDPDVSNVTDQIKNQLQLNGEVEVPGRNGSREDDDGRGQSETTREEDQGGERGALLRQDTLPFDEAPSGPQDNQRLQDQANADARLLHLSTGEPARAKRQNSSSPSVLGSCTGCFSFVGGRAVSPNSSFSVEPCLIRPVLPYESSASTSMSSVQATGGHTPKSSTSSEEGSSGANARAQYLLAKKEFSQHLGGCVHLYSDLGSYAALHPYFSIPRTPSSIPGQQEGPEGQVHLVVCVHGLDGNRADLRLLKMYIEMGLPQERFEFLMSESNQEDTFAGFDRMTERLIQEILYYVELLRLKPKKVSFIGHSLGNLIIRSALAKPGMAPFLDKLHTFLSLSGPHLGQLYNSSTLVNTGLWVMQKWKKSNSLLQLSLRDHTDPRQSFLYQLSKNPGLAMFKNVLLVGSLQDRYVPVHSARVEMCKAAAKDKSIYGTIYAEMLNNLLEPVITSPQVTLVRYDVHHSLQTSANTLIGRAAHIAFLDSELFLEKFLMVSALSYFR